MHVCRFVRSETAVSQLGIFDADDGATIRPIATEASTLEEALQAGETWESLCSSASEDRQETDEVTLLSPVERPTNLIGVGLNYAGHAAEGGHDVPDEPIFFAKSAASTVGAGAEIIKHDVVSDLHYEGEFAFVIGQTCRQVDADEALDRVFGFLPANDVTARDMQAADIGNAHPWFRSKSMETFTPLGAVTPRGEGVDPANARIETRLNGDVVQSSNTDDLIFTVPEVVSYISRFVTLNPGDVVLTGTPAGVGSMASGDVVEVDIEGAAPLRNEVVPE